MTFDEMKTELVRRGFRPVDGHEHPYARACREAERKRIIRESTITALAFIAGVVTSLLVF